MKTSGLGVFVTVSSMLGLLLSMSCARGPESASLATYDGGTVEITQLESLLLDLPAAQQQPPDERTVGDWLGELALDVALEDALRSRARSEGDADDRVLLLQARYLASREIGSVFAQTRCPIEDVSDAEVDRALIHRDPAEPKEWILLRHIFKRVPTAASAPQRDAVRAEMSALLEQLENGANFIDLARKHSESKTAAEGGLIGRVSRAASMDAVVLEVAWKLPDGGHSDIIAVSNGFHILRRDASGVEQPPTREMVRDQLRQQLATQRQELCGRALVAELAVAVGVVIDPTAALEPAALATVVAIGDEAFTVEDLKCLSEEPTPIAELGNLPVLLQNFVEALLLAESARAEDPATDERFVTIEADFIDHLMLSRQWGRERLRAVSARSNEELKAYFRAHRERFATEGMIDVSVLVIHGSRPTDNRAIHERVLAVGQRISDGESFADVARELSEHLSREQGGRLGWMPVSRTKALLGKVGYRATADLDPGQVSQPFQVVASSAPSWALVMVHDRKPPEKQNFADARDQVIEALTGEGVQQLDLGIRHSLKEEINFRVNRRVMERYVRTLGGETD